MMKMNEAKDEAYAKAEEVTELQSQLRKAGLEKRRADDKIELLTADKEEAETKAGKFQEEIDACIRDYESKIDSMTVSCVQITKN